MSQASVVLPNSGVVSGVTFANDLNAALDALRTMYLGAAAPSADTPEEGQQWLDSGSSTSYKIERLYDGANWLFRAAVDDVNHIYIPPVGGGNNAVASASTAALGGTTAPAAAVSISGTTGIVSFGSNATQGQIFFLTFQGVLTLTYNAASMILPGKANITTAAGDMAIAQYLGSSNWQVVLYQPISTLLGSVGTVTGSFITNNVITPTQITGNQNNYAPTGNANAVIWELNSDGLSDYLITGIAGGTSGRHIILRNSNAAGGGRFYFPNQSASSTSSNRFMMPGVLQLNPGQQVAFIYDNAATAWVPQNVVSAQPVQGGRKNLYAGNAAGFNFTAPGTPTTQVKITADQLLLSDVDGNTVNLANVSVTATITSTGVNGLDSYSGIGLSTGAWYSGWVIFNPLTNTAAALLSTSQTAPTMPSGYTFKTRCTWATTNPSTTKNLAPVLQIGAHADYVPSTGNNRPLIASGVSTANASASTAWVPSAYGISNLIPPTAAQIYCSLSIGQAGQFPGLAPGSSLAFAPPNGLSSTGALPPIPLIGGSGSGFGISFSGNFAPWSTSVYYQSGSSLAAAWCSGWDDNL